MTESSERKIKLLLLYEILRKQTDERHPMTTGEIYGTGQKAYLISEFARSYRNTMYIHFCRNRKNARWHDCNSFRKKRF